MQAADLEGQWLFVGDRPGEFESVWRYQAAAEASGSPNVIVCAMETDIGDR